MCFSECKRAVLTIKTGTGIKRFQEDKGYGAWFHKLYDIVKTRDSCQPEQAIEPSAHQFVRNENQGGTLTGTEDNSTENESTDTNQNLFVPTKRQKRKSSREEPICEAIKLMKTLVEKDPSKELIAFMKDDIEKARQRELTLMQMMLSFGNQQAFQGQNLVPPVGHAHYASHNLSDGYHQPYQPTAHYSRQSNYTPDFSMQQRNQGVQFRPISPTSVNSNYSSLSPLSIHEGPNDPSGSPLHHSM